MLPLTLGRVLRPDQPRAGHEILRLSKPGKSRLELAKQRKDQANYGRPKGITQI